MILSIERLLSSCQSRSAASWLSCLISRHLELARWAKAALGVLTLSGFIVLPIPAHASALECPEVGRGAVPALIGDAQIKRMTTGNDADLAAEVDGLIGQLRAQNSRASDTEIANILIAAYCPVVAQKADASLSEKWQLMRQFDRVLMRQLAAAAMPAGSLIIANVPLPPTVYQNLSSQAEAQGQTAADFMATILTRAARQ